ncbi:type VI secretion system tip protein VgrG [Chitinophaga sp. Cy-1792]|uniref:type VI secretion system tip protein VgrG n=1 Tax=Chitinophaga sp. Cy-1792 TaxID=2608339 RepID=UPI00141E6FCF|nr:type VI secretion system tip protein VgrG [Chitinophaga sp. Cy-1792]NIG53825.1 type VI secretion system tip protein VgrG [Chitinophaga sp. Cy-1792]
MPDNRDIQTPAPPSVATFSISAAGNAVTKSYQISSIMVMKEVNRIPAATIVIQDGEASKQTFPVADKDDFLPGTAIEIKAGYRGKEDTIFKGQVIRTTIRVRKNVSLLYVECRDKIFSSSLSPQNKYYKDQKDSEIIEDILGKYQLDKDVTATTIKHTTLVQYQQSDWDFLLQRATATNMHCIINDGKGSFKVPDLGQSPAETIQYGSSLLEMDLELDARTQPPELKIISWDQSSQDITTTTAKEPAGKLNGDLSGKDLAGKINAADSQLLISTTIPAQELQLAADAMLMRTRLSACSGRVNCQGTAKIVPGCMIALNGIGKHYQGNAYVTGVKHMIIKGNWTTDAQIGVPVTGPAGISNNATIAIPQGITTLQTGIVTKLENDPGKEDRIQVTLPSIDPKDDGVWARVGVPDAGNKRGAYFRPEIKDEVLVAFLDGNPNYPVVLGGLNSSALPAPITAKDTNDEKGFVTRSGMKMIFNDDKKSYQLETPGGNKITVSDDAKGIVMADQNGNKITMNDNGITIESPKDIQFKATGDMNIQGKTNNLKATLGFKADGGSGCEISAGNGITAVKGALVQIN